MSTASKLRDAELAHNVPDSASWHQDFKDTSWVFVGGLHPNLTEGDVVCALSQFGEVEDLDMPRDEQTGKPRGFAFVKFEDFRAAVLTVDNFDGVELLGQRLKLDHYRPKRIPDKVRVPPAAAGAATSASAKRPPPVELSTEERLAMAQPGFKYRDVEGGLGLHSGVDVFAASSSAASGLVESGVGADWRRRDVAVAAAAVEDDRESSRRRGDGDGEGEGEDEGKKKKKKKHKHKSEKRSRKEKKKSKKAESSGSESGGDGDADAEADDERPPARRLRRDAESSSVSASDPDADAGGDA